jgi:hypothetical protein
MYLQIGALSKVILPSEKEWLVAVFHIKPTKIIKKLSPRYFTWLLAPEIT